MNILCTFPGRAGDLLWALPTLRALSRRIDTQIDLQICGEFAGLVPLLRLQPYLRYVHADPRWNMSEGWQASALDTGGYYDQIFQLGYRRWPELGLPFETLHTLNCANQFPRRVEMGEHPIPEGDLDLSTPWITVAAPLHTSPVPFLCGFSECHFELKYGLWELLTENQDRSWSLYDRAHRMRRAVGFGPLSICVGARWAQEAGHKGCSWLEGAQWMTLAQVFLGCNSGWHVLAVAMGVPVVMVEPMEARHNPIFFPVGKTGPQVTLVTGNDGLPTYDARHVAEALEKRLQEIAAHA